MNFFSRVFNEKEYIIYENINMKINDLFLVNNLNNLEECINFLHTSFASAFSYDKINKVCYFKISLVNTKSTCCLNMNDVNYDISDSFITVFKKQVVSSGVICPTYINHLNCFIKLCKSFHFIMDKISFVIIFSSFHEAVQIMNCVYPLLINYKNIEIVTLIFDVEYNNKNKFNYQTAKKLWGLEILNYDNLLLFDSDFEFINPINIYDEAKKNCGNIHITYYKMTDFDKNVLNNANELLNINSTVFPLNLYWFINKELFTLFINYLKSRLNNSMNYNDYILYHSKIYFEIILYYLFILNFYTDKLSIIDYTYLSYKYRTYFLWDMNLNYDEIIRYNANIAIANYVNTDKTKYLIKVHNDR
jgi:hypothetical protein